MRHRLVRELDAAAELDATDLALDAAEQAAAARAAGPPMPRSAISPLALDATTSAKTPPTSSWTPPPLSR